MLLACEALDRRKFTMHRPLVVVQPIWCERATALLDEFGLCAADGRSSPRNLSYGDQRKLEVACRWPAGRGCCCSTSRWPASPPASATRCSALLERLDRAIAVLLIEHDMDVAFGFAETVTVLYQGRVLLEGSTRTRSARIPRVQEIYLAACKSDASR